MYTAHSCSASLQESRLHFFVAQKSTKKRWKLHRRRFSAWYYRVARYWRLPLMSGVALFQVLCRFPDLSVTTALRLEYRLPWFCLLSAPGRKPPRHVPCLQQQGMGLLSLSSAQRFPLGKKGACGRLGAVHCAVVAAGQELRAVPKKAALELALLLRERTVRCSICDV